MGEREPDEARETAEGQAGTEGRDAKAGGSGAGAPAPGGDAWQATLRALHRAGEAGAGAGPGRGARLQPQLHRHRAPPAGAAAGGGGSRRGGAEGDAAWRLDETRGGRRADRGAGRPQAVSGAISLDPAGEAGDRAGGGGGPAPGPPPRGHRAPPAGDGRSRGRESPRGSWTRLGADGPAGARAACWRRSPPRRDGRGSRPRPRATTSSPAAWTTPTWRRSTPCWRRGCAPPAARPPPG